MVSKLKKLYRLPHQHSTGTCLLYISLLLVTMSNDIELNPGPRTPKYPCGSCGKAVKNTQNSIQCDKCSTWHHIECQGMGIEVHKVMVNHESYSWSCMNCGLPNFNTTFFDWSFSSLETSNSFSCLDTQTPQPPLTPTPAKKLSQKFHRKQNPGRLKVLNINFRSVVNKVPEFHCLVDAEKPDIIVGTESWLSPDICNSEVYPPGYVAFRADRKSKAVRSGGVFILVRDNLRVTEQPEFKADCELIWVKLEVTGSHPLYIGAYYKPHEDDLTSLTELRKSIEQVGKKNGNNWLLGDFNLPGLTWTDNIPLLKSTLSSKPVYEYFLDLINDFGLCQMVTEPTRHSPDNTLDLFLTSNATLIQRVDILPGLGDHDVVLAEGLIKPVFQKQKPRKVHLFAKADWEKLKSIMKDFQSKFLSSHAGKSVEELWTSFADALEAGMQECIPMKLLSCKGSLPWITQEIKRVIRKRDKLYTAFKASGDSGKRKSFLALRQLIKRKIQQAYQSHLEGLLGLGNNDQSCDRKKLFSFLKNSRQDQQGPTPLQNNGKLTSDITDQCNVHNQQFQSVLMPRSPLSLSRLAQMKLQDMVDEGKMSPGTVPQTFRNKNQTMPQIEISINGILKLLYNLKPGKAAGPDKIRPLILKELRVELAPIIKVIFERSLETGKLPTDWCKANVTPIYKKGDKSLASNYRPISLTCILCKVLEHILASNIVRHLDGQGLMYDLQHGFREKRSCETQLIMLVEDLARNAGLGKQTDLILLDFSKAFDKVNHSKLIWKLHNYGIRSNVLNWIVAFLGDRTQKVVVGGEESDTVPVTSGVPQGSVLGPNLFLAYINDLPDKVTSQVRLFADDTAMYLTMEGAKNSSVLQQDLDRLSVWESDWDMEFNPSKCQVVQVAGSRKPVSATYVLHGVALETVTCARYLGVDVSSNLSWGSHIDRITGTAHKTLGFVKRNIKTKMSGVREAAYTTLVRPQLEYAAAIWDPHHKDKINQIEKVQRRAARWTSCNFDTRASVSDMLETLGWRSLQQRRADARLCLFFKIVNNMVAVSLPDYIQPNPRTSRRGHSRSFCQLHTGKNYYKYSFFPLAIVQWNALPEDVVSSPNLDIFKAAVGKLQHSKP